MEKELKMPKNLKFDFHDDVEGDLVDIFIGTPYATDNYDLHPLFTLRFDPRTHELVGLIIISFSSFFPNCSGSESRRQVTEGLMRLFMCLYPKQRSKQPRAA